MERNEEDEWHFVPYVRKVHWGPEMKEKTRKKSSFFNSTVRPKLLWIYLFLRWRLFPDGCKSVSSAQQIKRIGILVVFETRKWRFCSLYIEDALPSTSRCTCRPNNVHTYLISTHILAAKSHCHMSFFSRRTPVTDPMFDVSFSCIMLCHLRRYRYVNARKRGARHHPAVPHGWAAHARVADASRRAPPMDDRKRDACRHGKDSPTHAHSRNKGPSTSITKG